MFRNLIIRSHIKRASKRKKQFASWDTVKTITLIINNEGLNKSVLDNFIINSGKQVEVVLMDFKNKVSAIKDYTTFTSLDKSIWRLPKSKSLSKLKRKNSDLVIIAAYDNIEFASVLAAHINTPCVCGYRQVYGNLDLIIVRKENQSVVDYLNEVVNYLKMIKN